MQLLLDTDIGSDVDDAIALAVIAGSPEVTLQGVVTVYGRTQLRAQIARKYLRLAGLADSLPVAAGSERARSGEEIWWTGHEGAVFDNLDQEPVSDDGLGLLLRTVASTPGEVDVLAIGPLTNIAAALDADPNFAQNVKRLVIMGADFRPDRIAEHNFKCDVDAAQRVFQSDLNIVVGSLDVTKKVQLRPEDVDAIGAAGPLGEFLSQEIHTWWDFIGRQGNTPHDAVVATWLVRPDLFTETVCRVEIDSDGRSWSDLSVPGRVTLLDTITPDQIRDQIVQRIVRAAA